MPDREEETEAAKNIEIGSDSGEEKYEVHYKNLQFYLSRGMHLNKVPRVIEFDQEP